LKNEYEVNKKIWIETQLINQILLLLYNLIKMKFRKDNKKSPVGGFFVSFERKDYCAAGASVAGASVAAGASSIGAAVVSTVASTASVASVEVFSSAFLQDASAITPATNANANTFFIFVIN
jgi:hypothetical protein